MKTKKIQLINKTCYFLCVIFNTFICFQNTYAQQYHPDDKAALKAFLKQQSADPNKKNWQQLINPLNTSEPDWDIEEDWVNQIYVSWDNEIPFKRITLIDWDKKNLAGKLDLTNCSNLEVLNCSSNILDSLVINNLSNLERVRCSNNNINILDLSGLNTLRMLNCSNNQITKLDLSGLDLMDELLCFNNKLMQINLPSLGKIKYIDLHNNHIASLNVTLLKALQYLDCSQNQLNQLDIVALGSLTYLNCSENNLEQLNLLGIWNLEKLYCNNNKLNLLDVSNQSFLTEFNCQYNHLNSLDVSHMKSLKILHCFNNQLTSLSVTNLPELVILNCANNQIQSLNFGYSNELEQLYCNNNSLLSLNLQDLKSLKTLHCYGNQIPISQLPDGGMSFFREYIYAPQQNIIGESITQGTVNLHNQLKNEETEFWWYLTDDPFTELIDITGKNGVFTIPESYNGQILNCRITNRGLPAFSLQPIIYTVTVEKGVQVSIQSLPKDDIYVYTKENNLYIHTGQVRDIYIYSITGQLHTRQKINEGTTSIPLSKGVYIIVTGKEKYKVAI